MDNIIKKIENRLEVLDKRFLFFCLLLLMFFLGYLDYLTGFEFSFSLFYLFPVALAAWYTDKRSALILACLCAIIWYVSNDFAGQVYTQVYIGYWNMAIRLGFFVIVSIIMIKMKEALEREKELSNLDANTGLMNSRSFYQMASAELLRAKRYKRPFTLAYIDIDGFKGINDRLGHMSGDMVLKAVADTLRTHLRNTDLIARMGGDEFVALLPETEYISGSVVISKLQTHLLKTMERHHWNVTFSIGVVTYYKYDMSLKEVLQQADKMMYIAKEEGKDTIRFDTLEK